MKKKILCGLLCIVLALSAVLSGCGKKQNTGKVDSNKQQQTDKDADKNADKDADKEVAKKPTFHIVVNGATDYVIVRGANATETEIYAAEELQAYLKQISGAKLPIVTDKKAVAEKEIIVGKTNREEKGAFDRTELTEDGFVIKTTGSKLWLVGGGNRGTLYSVYTFLEEYLGCRYYTVDIEKVPETKNVSIVEIKEDKQIPQFYLRVLNMADSYDEDISAKHKINTNLWQRKLTEKVGGALSFCKGVGGHNYLSLVQPELYFDEHPEYFTMNEKGERVKNQQLCLTNPDVYKIALASVRQWLEEDPSATVMTISQMDNEGACYCDNCKAVYEEEGGTPQGTNLRFVNAIARELKDEYPNVMFDTYAYNYTVQAPTKTVPEDNVMVRLCTMGTCFNHSKPDNKCGEQSSLLDGQEATATNYKNFEEHLKAWSAITDNLFIYDYYTNYYYFCLTWTDLDNIRENMQFYAENKVIGFEAHANQYSESIEFGQLRAYLVAKLMWDPYMSDEEYYAHMDDFLQGVYGPGGKYIRDFIELSEELTKDVCCGLSPTPYDLYPVETVEQHAYGEVPKKLTVDMVKNYEKTDWSAFWNFYTDVKENQLSVQGEILFGKALAVAETETQKAQIERTYLQVQYLKSYYHAKQISAAEGELPDMIKAFIKANQSKFTEEESQKLPSAINKFATDQMYNKYAAYNRTLCEALVNAGVTYRWEGGSLEGWQAFDFAGTPPTWTSK